MIGDSYLLPETRCPACKKKIDSAMKTEEDSRTVPDEDFSICAYCLTWLRFNKDWTLRIATEEDLKDLTSSQIKYMKGLTLAMRKKLNLQTIRT